MKIKLPFIMLNDGYQSLAGVALCQRCNNLALLEKVYKYRSFKGAECLCRECYEKTHTELFEDLPKRIEIYYED